MEYLIDFIWFWNVWQSDTIGCCVWIAKQLLNQFSFKIEVFLKSTSYLNSELWLYWDFSNYSRFKLNRDGFIFLKLEFSTFGLHFGHFRKNLENSRFLWSYRVKVFSWKTKSYKRQNQVNRHLSCLYVMLSSMKMSLYFTTNAGLAWVKNCHFIFTLKVVCW